MSTRDGSGKPNIVDPAWPRFYFNGNQGWGWIESREDWEWLQRVYAHGYGDSGAGVVPRLLSACCLTGEDRHQPQSFGLYGEFGGKRTLADHFAAAGFSPYDISPSPTTEEGPSDGGV